MIRVIVNGAKGKMGAESVKAIENTNTLSLVATLDHGDNLVEAIEKHRADVVLDFTNPSSVFENTKQILNAGARPVIGTTGLSPEELDTLRDLSKETGLGVMICPNFAIGAILMMKAAEMTAKWMTDVEIIETHHQNKLDAPSGTAIKTAELIHAANPNINPNLEKLKSTELVPGARGGETQSVPIHSVRLPGFIADQSVVFGGPGQRLRITHESLNRESFMPGVILAIRHVMGVSELIYGLEHALGLSLNQS